MMFNAFLNEHAFIVPISDVVTIIATLVDLYWKLKLFISTF